MPAGVSPIDVTFDEAVALLAQPKTGGRGRGPAAKKEPLKVFAASPVTNNPVQLLEGRYGPYVSDGETNASLPRDSKPDELTFEAALDLLAVRAAMGGSKKKKAPRKSAAAKAPKKSESKKAAAGTATKKASSKKAPLRKHPRKEFLAPRGGCAIQSMEQLMKLDSGARTGGSQLR